MQICLQNYTYGEVVKDKVFFFAYVICEEWKILHVQICKFLYQCVTNIRIFSAEYLIFEYEYSIFMSRIYSNISKNPTNIFKYFDLSFTSLTLDKHTRYFRFL